VSADIFKGGIIGGKAVGGSGVRGIGPYGVTVGPKAIGGTVTFAGGYWVHEFTASGTFTPLVPSLEVEYLVVAGGGGGNGDNSRAGGGGLMESESSIVTAHRDRG
jgi:hypothetical protein